MNSNDTLNDTAQQIEATLEELYGRLTPEDRIAVGRLSTRMCEANPLDLENENADVVLRLSYAALSYTLTVLSAYMGAQARPRCN
jgi:hypothetical protein